MKNYQLNVMARQGTGRSASRRLRNAGKIPAVLYGKHTKPESLAVGTVEFIQLLKDIAGKASLVELKRDSAAPSLSILQEIQRDPITDRFLHIDLQEVKENEKMVINVTVHLTGESTGVKNENGVLEIGSHQVRIRCLPKDLPPFIEVDVTELSVGKTIHLGDLKPITGVEFLGSKDQPVVSCVEPVAEVVVEAAAAAPVAGAVPAEGAAPAAGAVPAEGAAAAPAGDDAKAAAGAPAKGAAAPAAAAPVKGAGDKKAAPAKK
ncbi:MAG: 50S ribosomal protein L25 [Opitutaceae bacterium]|nr:50S ribosomal protein L25 [Opitutaceae bacterium]